MKKHLCLPICFVVCLLARLHGVGYAKVEWEEIDEAELKKTAYEEAPEAPAVILFDRGRIDMGFIQGTRDFNIIREKYCRIKILTEKGYDYANVRILRHEKEKIDDLEARTILPDGKVIELDKNEFHKNIIKTGGDSGDWYETVFTFPALEPGCIIEYKYEKKSQNIFFIDKWYFQNELYTFHSKITAEILSFFSYTYYLFPPGIIRMQTGEEKLWYDGNVKLQKGQFIWELDSIPGIVNEPLSPPMNSYRTQIFFAMSAFRFPGQLQKVPIFNSWNKVAETYFNMYSGIKGSKEIKAAAEQCTGASTQKAEKIRDIFNYVKEHCRYKKSYVAEVYPTEPKATLKNKEGDTADLSALMIQMLRDVDIEAFPAVILTKHDPPFLNNFPSPTQFTKMIVYIPDPENPLWINPAGSFVNCEMLPWDDQEQAAIIINSKEGTFSKTPSSTPAENVISHDATMTIGPEGSIEVVGSVTLSGVCEDICAGKIDGMTEEDCKKYVKEQVCPFNEDAEITALDIPQDLHDLDSLCIHYSFKSASGVQAISDRLILNPAISHRLSAEPFEALQRANPVFLKYPYSINVALRLNIPEGYELAEALKAANLERPWFQYNRNIEQKGNELLYEKNFSLLKTMFLSTGYPSIRRHYQRLAALDEESLVLRKTSLSPGQDNR